MVRKRQAKEPLFYIQQPKISKPIAPMQANYSTAKRSHEDSSKQNEGNSPFNRPVRGNTFQQFQSPQPVVKSEQEKEDVPEQVSDEKTEVTEGLEDNGTDTNEEKNRSKFKDMTIPEKIDYFVHLPPHIPRLKCEVTTEDHTYRGMIIAREEKEEGEIIVLRSGRRNVTILTKTVIEIKLLGM